MEKVILSHFKTLDLFRIYVSILDQIEIEPFYFTSSEISLCLCEKRSYQEVLDQWNRTLRVILINNLPTGLKTISNDLGNLVFERFYKNGLKNGFSMEYWNEEENDAPRCQGFFKNGEANGYWVYWYSKGLIESEEEFGDTSQKSLHIEYFTDGQKSAQGFYREGSKNGFWTFFHENGQKKSEGIYENDKKIGSWFYWDSGGKRKHSED